MFAHFESSIKTEIPIVYKTYEMKDNRIIFRGQYRG